MSWLPTFNKEVLNLSSSLAIQMASILSAGAAAGRLLAGIFLKKVSWLTLLVTCLVLAASLLLITIPMTRNIPVQSVHSLSQVPLVAFAFPLIGFFLAPIYPAINSIILSNLPKHKHGSMSGLIVVFSALGGTTGSIITGHIFGAYGGQTAMYFALMPMGILVILLFAFRFLQNKTGVTSKIQLKGGH